MLPVVTCKLSHERLDYIVGRIMMILSEWGFGEITNILENRDNLL
jgi:hypothetical protein